MFYHTAPSSPLYRTTKTAAKHHATLSLSPPPTNDLGLKVAEACGTSDKGGGRVARDRSVCDG